MQTSRRKFMAAAIGGMTGASLAPAWSADKPAKETTDAFYKLFPIGRVEKKGAATLLRVFEEYADGLLGLDGWSHVNVIYWFDRNDTPQQRRVLRVHPRGDTRNPLTGVFACRAPMRPNLIALSLCKLVSVQGSVITVDGLDAFDGTPLLDLKPFIPPDGPTQEVRTPAWARERRPGNP